MNRVSGSTFSPSNCLTALVNGVKPLFLFSLIALSLIARAQLANSSWPKFRGNALNTGQAQVPPTTGTLKFATALSGTNASSPVVGTDGTVYIGSGNNLVAMDAKGNIKWTVATGALIYSSPLIANGTIYIGSSDDYLYAVNPNGSLKWKFQTAGEIIASPITNGVNILVGTYEGSATSGHLYLVKDSGNSGTQVAIVKTAGVVGGCPAFS